MELGCCILPEYLPHVKCSGFDFAELPCSVTVPTKSDAEWAEIRDRLLGYGVPIKSFNVLLPPDIKIVGDDVDQGRIEGYLRVVFQRMADLGGEHVSLGSAGARRIPAGFDEKAAREQLLSFIHLLSDVAEPHSIQINLEFLNQKETNLMVSLLEANEYAEMVNRPSVRILADLYHLMEEDEPLTDLLSVRESLGYVHVADTMRRHPGSGSYPFTEFFELLQQIGYGGPVSVECMWDKTEEEMKTSAQFLRSLLTGEFEEHGWR